MKRYFLTSIVALILLLSGANLRVLTLTPSPQMHCENCENKIKQNMRFEKGVKKVETNLKTQHVTITYDPNKNTVEGLQAGMKKIGYATQVVSDQPQQQPRSKRK